MTTPNNGWTPPPTWSAATPPVPRLPDPGYFDPQYKPGIPTKTKSSKLLIGGALVIALLGGVGLGSSGQKTVTVASPAQTITATATTTTTRTPASCLAALDDADALVATYVKAITTAAEMIQAAGAGDVSALTTGTAKFKQYTAEVNANPYPTDRDACRAGK